MTTFSDLGIHPKVLSALKTMGFETPTPVQAESIPFVMEGKDVLVQAKTGTGKTAAFGLPLISKLNINDMIVQGLIVVPTRELAIQVAEAIRSFAKQMGGVNVVEIVGGKDYSTQLRGLRKGGHVVVGTPGRLMDHIKKGTLDLSKVKTLVLDEADEMLKMGFIDDIEWILEHVPDNAQTALFSATMPSQIKKIAGNYLTDPAFVTIKSEDRGLSSIEQVYTVVYREHKFEALLRFLTVEHTDAAIIFTRTKIDTCEVSDKLCARGYRAAAINGDMDQPLREKVINNLKRGVLDVVVATDVAARGLDVPRIEYVVNYDIPFDVESYVHRIGRTGRAGRTGKSLSLISPKDCRMMHTIKRVTGYDIKEVTPPTIEAMHEHTESHVFEQISKHAESMKDIDKMREKVAELQETFGCDSETLAAVLLSDKLGAALGNFEDVKFLPKSNGESRSDRGDRGDRRNNGRSRDRRGASSGDRYERSDRSDRGNRGGRDSGGRREETRPRTRKDSREEGMSRFVMNLGRDNDVSPSDVVGFIANRCNINRKLIGRINIGAKSTHVDISTDVSNNIIKQLGDSKFKRQDVTFKLD